jgi:uncharacterized protein YceH (UPF0502 family)
VNLLLSEPELRVFGVLVEKEMSTPDYYPMSLNALVNACNQKTNREPITNYDEETVTATLQSLQEKGISTRILGDRVAKYGHRAYERLNLGRRELALLAVLMLRGPQTVNELKDRTQRLHDFEDFDSMENTLRKMSELEMTRLLPKLPGQREARWVQLLGGEPSMAMPSEASAPALKEDRIGKLEAELAALRAEFDEFKKRFE